MVDSNYAMDGFALEFELAWELLRDGKKLSMIDKKGAHVLSFRLRPAATKTPATVQVLVGSRYFDAGWLRPEAKRLQPLVRNMRQAPLEGFEREAAYRLFDEFLLQGGTPAEAELVERELFDQGNEDAYEAAQPEIFRHLLETNNQSCLNRIRNCGALTEAQEGAIRSRMAKRKPRSGNGARAPEAGPVNDEQAAADERVRKMRELFKDE